MTQRQILLGTIAVLVPIWWLSRPVEAPDFAQGSSRPPQTSDVTRPARSTSTTREAREPAWTANIDTSRPECVKLKTELLAQAAESKLPNNIMYIGDCDTRVQTQPERN